jgi:hypothetical protein
MWQSNHDPMKAIFYQNTPGEDFMGRTRSFQSLKDEGATQPLFGLEQIVKKHPRSAFVVKPAKTAAA